MNVLDLFSGAGGGILGGVLLGWRCVGAVEINEYCCKVLRQRQLDGCLERFPIWNMDIRRFNTDVAPSYAGMVDLIAAGFPCQPFSVAGKRRGADDERNMWPATIECIRAIRPRFALLENVPGILSTPYWGTVLGDLAEAGYAARWMVLGADDCGANHRRKRLWVLADSECAESWPGTASEQTETGQRRSGSSNSGSAISDSLRPRLEGEQCDRRNDAEEQPTTQRNCYGGGWWSVEPDVGRVADGVAHRVDRLKALGNGQVSIVASTAFRILAGDIQ